LWHKWEVNAVAEEVDDVDDEAENKNYCSEGYGDVEFIIIKSSSLLSFKMVDRP